MIIESLVIFHNGSYMEHVSKEVCLVGFMIYCLHSRNRAKGSMVERYPSADNYRAEILGGIVAQLVLHAASR